MSNVSHFTPSNIRGGSLSSDSTIRGGIARSDSTRQRVHSNRSAESSISSSDVPDLDSQVSSSHDDDGDDRTISTVATDTDASLIFDMLHDDPEFASLRLNSVVLSRVPEEVIAIDNLEEGEWTDNDKDSVENKAFKNIQELRVSEIATGALLSANRYEAHLDGGSQASTTNDILVLWGYKPFTDRNPCRVRLICADGKCPIIPIGSGTVRIPADNADGYVPIKCFCPPEIPNFILSPNSFKSLLGKNTIDTSWS